MLKSTLCGSRELFAAELRAKFELTDLFVSAGLAADILTPTVRLQVIKMLLCRSLQYCCIIMLTISTCVCCRPQWRQACHCCMSSRQRAVKLAWHSLPAKCTQLREQCIATAAVARRYHPRLAPALYEQCCLCSCWLAADSPPDV